MNKIIPLLIVLFLTVEVAYSQVNRNFIDTVTVKEQFDYMIKYSNRYQEYKIVRIDWLDQLKSNVTDSLTSSKKEIINNYRTISEQRQRIDSLEKNLDGSKKLITDLDTEKERISFVGISVSKNLFKVIFIFIIGFLLVLLIFFISRYGRSNSITRETRSTLKELEEEYETHRERALEREQLVRRQLQDELNKNKKE